ELDFDVIGREHGVDFIAYFGDELRALEPLQRDGIVRRAAPGLVVTDTGRFLLRNVCAVFDRNLRQDGAPAGYSRAI
ncbi:MAG: oxygen-independent coproporphyrinogen III oxidase, partial [Gammaproteobacteria bacterium]